MFYLIPHTSHILQPLNLSVFSSLKRAYRAAISLDVFLENDAPVKKQRFIKYYEKARAIAIYPSNYASSFKSAGIVPFNPEKAINSRFTLPDKANINQVVPTIPQTIPDVLTTPRNRRQLEIAIYSVDKSYQFNREARTLLHKTERALENSQIELATTRKQISSYERQLASIKKRSTKKKAINSNRIFLNIEDLRRAQNGEEPRPAEAIQPTITTSTPVTAPSGSDSSSRSFIDIANSLASIRALGASI